MPLALPDVLTPLIEASLPWLHQYGLWAVGLGLFTETLMFTGFWVPGFGILVAAGFLCGDGALPSGQVLVAASVGAVLGDQASYLLGRYGGRRLLRERRRPQADRVGRVLQQEGCWLLLFYHYAPPLRALLPFVAGMVAYQRVRWLVYDTVGVLLWVAVVWLLGYLAHGAVRPSANIAMQATTGFVTIAFVVLTIRIARRLRRLDDDAVADTADED